MLSDIVVGIGCLILYAFIISFGFINLIKGALIVDLAIAGITIEEKSEWIKFSNQGVWCRPAKEWSEHAEICQEEEPE